MIDPDNIPTDSKVTLELPFLIEVRDYHDLRMYQQFIRADLGLLNVYVTEVGVMDGAYMGLVHLDTESHNQLVLQLDNYCKAQEE